MKGGLCSENGGGVGWAEGEIARMAERVWRERRGVCGR